MTHQISATFTSILHLWKLISRKRNMARKGPLVITKRLADQQQQYEPHTSYGTKLGSRQTTTSKDETRLVATKNNRPFHTTKSTDPPPHGQFHSKQWRTVELKSFQVALFGWNWHIYQRKSCDRCWRISDLQPVYFYLLSMMKVCPDEMAFSFGAVERQGLKKGRLFVAFAQLDGLGSYQVAMFWTVIRTTLVPTMKTLTPKNTTVTAIATALKRFILMHTFILGSVTFLPIVRRILPKIAKLSSPVQTATFGAKICLSPHHPNFHIRSLRTF